MGNMNPFHSNKKPIAGVKGLTNKPGENNCFLNSAIQVLWKLDAFRDNFRLLEGHYCLDTGCIFCAMKILFTQYEYNENRYLPPNVLRKALADFFSSENRFNLGQMNDAAEAFENILKRIHFHLIPDSSENNWCFTDYCISHTRFSMNIKDKILCTKCHAEVIVQQFSQLTYYINASCLVLENATQPLLKEKLTYGKLIKQASKSDEILSCPGGTCGKTAQNIRELNNCPDIVTIGVTWESNSISENSLNEFYKCIKPSFEIQDLFDSLENIHLAYTKNDYKLEALICYYGRHYTAFCFSRMHNEWFYMSDTNVEAVGPLFEDVIIKCKKNRFQPYLLFYCAEHESPFNVKNAPKNTQRMSTLENFY